MTEEQKTTESRDVPPVQVTVLGTGDGSRLASGIAMTEGSHVPNIAYTVIKPVVMVLVRGLKAFVISLVALLPVAGVTGIIPAQDFMELLAKCASLSVGIGVTAALTALGEVLTNLDQKLPTWTA